VVPGPESSFGSPGLYLRHTTVDCGFCSNEIKVTRGRCLTCPSSEKDIPGQLTPALSDRLRSEHTEDINVCTKGNGFASGTAANDPVNITLSAPKTEFKSCLLKLLGKAHGDSAHNAEWFVRECCTRVKHRFTSPTVTFPHFDVRSDMTKFAVYSTALTQRISFSPSSVVPNSTSIQSRVKPRNIAVRQIQAGDIRASASDTHRSSVFSRLPLRIARLKVFSNLQKRPSQLVGSSTSGRHPDRILPHAVSTGVLVQHIQADSIDTGRGMKKRYTN